MYLAHPLDQRLAAVLPVGSLYAVGGRVRDELRSALSQAGPQIKDFDYVVTGVELDELRGRLGTLGRVDLVGAAFAVLKVTIEGVTVDVALPRRERSTGIGHREFAVQSGPEVPLTDDLARRDFRMNMIARALPGGELVDPYGGEGDIRAGRIDLLSPRAFEEDPLRMLRAAQFGARFRYTPTQALIEAMTAAAPSVVTVSPERIAEECSKLLVLAEEPSIGFELLRTTGVLGYLWPELVEGVGVEQNEWHAHDVWRHTMATLDATPPGDLIGRLSALLHDVAKPRTKDGPHFYRHEQVGADLVREMLGRFRFSNDVIDTTEHLVRQHMYVQNPELSDGALRRFIRRVGVTHLERQFGLRRADIAGSGLPKRDDSNERFEQRVWAEVARKPAFSVADLAIGGRDVIDCMVRAGLAEPNFQGDARVGALLQELFEQVTDDPVRNDRRSLLSLLDENLSRAERAS